MKNFKERLEEKAKEKDLMQYKTDDFQRRGGSYPKSGVPDSIMVWKNTLSFLFKNTSEPKAKAWVERWMKGKGLKGKVTTSQDGDYQDDWVEARAEIK